MGTYYNLDKTSNLDTSGSILRQFVSNHSGTNLVISDTSSTLTNMYHMFGEQYSWKKIDLRSLHTDKVTDITYLFTNCTNLTTVYMSNYLYNVKEAKWLCWDCHNLSTFPNLRYATQLVNLDSAFLNCPLLYNINSYSIGYINAQCNNIYRMTGTFENCSNLNNVSLTNWNAPKLTSILNLCQNDYNLRTVNFAGGNFINLNSGVNAFAQCRNLTTVNLANCNFSTTANITRMFYNCSNITSIKMSPMVVNNIASLFYNCRNLQNINLSGWNTCNCNTMAYLFRYCSGLTDITFDNNFINLGNVNSTAYMFYNCNNLESVPSGALKGVQDSTFMFYNCKKLSGGISNFNTAYLQNAYGLFYGTNIWSYSGGYGDNTTDTSYMFAYCYNLLTANIYYWTPQNLLNTTGMFRDCFNLYNVNMNKFKCNNTYDISFMFCGCNNLSTLLTNGVYFNGALYMNHMFYDCKKLTGPNILENANFSNIMYAQYMFYNCTNLTSLNSGTWNMCNAMYLNNMFAGCRNLVTVNFTGWNLSNAVNIGQMFAYCNNLSSSTLDQFSRLLYNANNVAFKNLSNTNTYSPFYGTNFSIGISSDMMARGWSI